MTFDKDMSPLMLWAFEKKSIDIQKKIPFDECCKNTYKINDYRNSILFCQYLRNENLDLHDILCGSLLLSCEP